MAPTNQSNLLFPELPICGINPPSNPFLRAALEYTRLHTTPATVNHTLRSAIFALLCSRKLPHLANVDTDLVVYSCIMHDMGWSKNPSLISQDKRFEVDGANIARNWIREHINEVNWDERQIQLTWDAIALHTTQSIASYKETEVAAVSLGILSDITGPLAPGALVTEDEYREVITAIPRIGLTNSVIDILCGLCRDKPDTTFHNFVSQYGARLGLDGKGTGRDHFARQVEEHSIANMMLRGMTACDQLEKAWGIWTAKRASYEVD